MAWFNDVYISLDTSEIGTHLALAERCHYLTGLASSNLKQLL
jgi:hypothetical protein